VARNQLLINTVVDYCSQLGQDRYLNDTYFKNKQAGVFVDVGAHDGITYSNSKYFESIGWTGLCVEPIPNIFDQLKANRKCICENYAISDNEGEDDFLLVHGYAEMLSGLVKEYEPKHVGRIDGEIHHYGGSKEIIKVKTVTLQTLLDKHNISSIDFLSLDTEGNELKVLKTIDFNKVNIFAISLENNYKDEKIRNFLVEKGFTHIKSLDVDDIFIKN